MQGSVVHMRGVGPCSGEAGRSAEQQQQQRRGRPPPQQQQQVAGCACPQAAGVTLQHPNMLHCSTPTCERQASIHRTLSVPTDLPNWRRAAAPSSPAAVSLSEAVRLARSVSATDGRRFFF